MVELHDGGGVRVGLGRVHQLVVLVPDVVLGPFGLVLVPHHIPVIFQCQLFKPD